MSSSSVSTTREKRDVAYFDKYADTRCWAHRTQRNIHERHATSSLFGFLASAAAMVGSAYKLNPVGYGLSVAAVSGCTYIHRRSTMLSKFHDRFACEYYEVGHDNSATASNKYESIMQLVGIETSIGLGFDTDFGGGVRVDLPSTPD